MKTRHLSLTPLLVAAVAGTALGQFSFTGPTDYPTPQRPDGVAIGDWDGVNGADLAVATDSPDKVSLLFNAGDGTFTGPVNILTGSGTGPGYIVAADLVGDASLDLAVALQNTNSVLILRGDGAGGFTQAGTFPVGEEPRHITAHDFNGDGQLDLAVVNREGNSVTILTNSGGVFTGSTFGVGEEPRASAAGEFTGDGIPDLVVSVSRERSLVILAGDGAGGFTLAQTLLVNQATRPEGVIAADLNGDGLDDIATGAGDPAFVSVFLQANGFAARTDYATGGTGVGDLTAADFDGDGRLDLVAVNEDSGNVALLRNLGNRQFGPAQLLPVGLNPSHVATGDLGGSAAPEIVVTNRDGDSTSVFLNDADPCVADFNNDGEVNTLDVLAFLNAWNAGDSRADINGDGVINTQDVLAFLNLWNAGC
jgi:hypothetical protein